jgi:hypothetical protein
MSHVQSSHSRRLIVPCLLSHRIEDDGKRNSMAGAYESPPRPANVEGEMSKDGDG